MKDLVKRLTALKIYGTKIKKILDTEKTVYLLYSNCAEYGVKSWFSDNEIDTNWDLRFCSRDLKEAEKLGFNLSEEEKSILFKESYSILGFNK